MLRFAVIMLGIACSLVAGATTLGVVVSIVDPVTRPPEITFIHDLLDFMLMILQIAIFVGAIILLPVLILACFAEKFGWHNFSIYVLLGPIIGAAAVMVMADKAVSQGTAIGAVSGLIGASVYWLIAGRNAGKIRKS